MYMNTTVLLYDCDGGSQHVYSRLSLTFASIRKTIGKVGVRSISYWEQYLV